MNLPREGAGRLLVASGNGPVAFQAVDGAVPLGALAAEPRRSAVWGTAVAVTSLLVDTFDEGVLAPAASQVAVVPAGGVDLVGQALVEAGATTRFR